MSAQMGSVQFLLPLVSVPGMLDACGKSCILLRIGGLFVMAWLQHPSQASLRSTTP